MPRIGLEPESNIQRTFIRALGYVAFELYGRSRVFGMGIVQATDDHEKVKSALVNTAFNTNDDECQFGSHKIYLDYVFGRMVKTEITVTTDGRITLSHSSNPEYQSWYRSGLTDKEVIGKALEKLVDDIGITTIGVEELINNNV